MSDLKLGSITEVWKSETQWKKFCQFLEEKMDPEGFDSEGTPLKLSRYALFLRLYVELYHREKQLKEEEEDPNWKVEVKSMVLSIKDHDEDFFGTERCMKCIDAGVRRQILQNVKNVRKNQAEPGSWVYEPAYPKVLDKLNSLLGPYLEIAELEKTE